ncbi:hypothetical protein JIN84_09970 [Luteolibacter yonseiensis]|uniref:DUF3856 domain-containing protein n=2 Tax=Luteolibacter yonseiensis TaxID=1144680 RepID=A0A934VBH6_9BACT|nr:hypothetical protein [Luteolibacter yonseiensis]
MLEGIARMRDGDFQSALRHFEDAANLRESQPWQEDPQAAWLLAAAYINRSDVLRALDRRDEAIHSLDRAIHAMRHVPLDQNPDCPERLILAWINRATTCGESGRPAEALTGFSKAEELLERWGTSATPERRLLASMSHANRARVLLDLGRSVGGWSSAGIAVDFLKGLDPTGPVAEASIKARGILCHSLAMLLDEPGGIELAQDWIATATNSAEEALALIRSSGYRAPWLADFVRYGAKIYRTCQPHFLGEFIREWTTGEGPLADDAVLKKEMSRELLLAKAELELRVRARPHESEHVRRAISTLSSLQRAEAALA